MKFRICHVYRLFYPVSMGGVETQIDLISNFLSEYDHDFHFSLVTDRVCFLPFLHRNLTKFESHGNLRVFRLGPNILKMVNDFFDVVQLRAKIQDRLYSRKLQEVVAKRLFNEAIKIKDVNEADIFHVHGLWDFEYELLAFSLSRFFGKPLVVHLRGTYLPGPEAMPLPDKLRMDILAYASAIITHNTNVFDKLKSWKLESRSYLIPNAVDTQKFKVTKRYSRRKKFTMVFVGRLSPFKDPITPVLATKILLKSGYGIELHIVGDGSLMSEVQSLVQELDLQNSVILHGARKDVEDFLSESDVFLATSPINNYPSNSLLEALASSLPIVATDVGLTGDIIDNGTNGLLVPAKNPERLAESIREIFENQKLREHLSANARSTAEKHDIRAIYPKIAQIYHSVL